MAAQQAEQDDANLSAAIADAVSRAVAARAAPAAIAPAPETVADLGGYRSAPDASGNQRSDDPEQESASANACVLLFFRYFACCCPPPQKRRRRKRLFSLLFKDRLISDRLRPHGPKYQESGAEFSNLFAHRYVAEWPV